MSGRSAGPRIATAVVDEEDNWMGDIKVNDAVIDVDKLEPIAPGSQMFRFPNPQQMYAETYRSKSFACFVEFALLLLWNCSHLMLLMLMSMPSDHGPGGISLVLGMIHTS